MTRCSLRGRFGRDSSISRVSFLADDSSGSVGTHLEEYSYLGLSTIVERNRPEPGVKLTYDSGNDTFVGAAGGDWTADGGEDDYAMDSGFQGGRHDAATADVHFRNRDLDVELGRWKTADPLGYVDGMSRYEFVGSGPATGVDPSGTVVIFVHGIGRGQSVGKSGHMHDGMKAGWTSAHQAEQGMIHFLYGPADARDPARPLLTPEHTQRNLDAAKALADLVKRLNDAQQGECREPVYVIGFSNGANVVKIALDWGMKADRVVFVGAAIAEDPVQPHLTTWRSMIGGGVRVTNFYSASDNVTWRLGMIGAHGSRVLSNKPVPNVEHTVNDNNATAASARPVASMLNSWGRTEWISYFMGQQHYAAETPSGCDGLTQNLANLLGQERSAKDHYMYDSGVR